MSPRETYRRFLMGGTVTLRELGIDKDTLNDVEKKRLEMENSLLREQVTNLQKFIAQKWFISLEDVQEHVDGYLTNNEIESIKVVQGRVLQHDWIMDELNRVESNMMEEFKRMEDLFRYGKESRAEGMS